MNVYLKSKNNENKILVKYILLLIPFLIYGFYKNGILLYKGEYVNIFYMFKPLILTIISILISYLFTKYKNIINARGNKKMEGVSFNEE